MYLLFSFAVLYINVVHCVNCKHARNTTTNESVSIQHSYSYIRRTVNIYIFSLLFSSLLTRWKNKIEKFLFWKNKSKWHFHRSKNTHTHNAAADRRVYYFDTHSLRTSIYINNITFNQRKFGIKFHSLLTKSLASKWCCSTISTWITGRKFTNVLAYAEKGQARKLRQK